ncbi:MAG: cupin domain-containing protein [Candidatus Geothermincolia bacterium]
MYMAAEPVFKHVHFTEVQAREFGPEAPGVSIRRLIDEEFDGAPFYNLRMLEISPNGHTPDHSHANEHENFVVEGVGEVMMEGEWHPLVVGDVVFVPPGARHQYRNTGDTTFRFLCGVPSARLLEP